MVGRARLELATNGLKEVVGLQKPIQHMALIDQKMSVRLLFSAKFESVSWFLNF